MLALSKQAKRPATGLPTVQLKPVEIEAIMLGAAEAPAEPVTTDQIVAIFEDTATPVDTSASSRGNIASGSQPIEVAAGGTPTVALAPVEIEAIMQAAGAAVAATGVDAPATTESLRLARGSSAMPPGGADVSAHARGPRRARETLRADAIRPPSRKR